MRAGPPEAASGSRRFQPTGTSPGWASILPISIDAGHAAGRVTPRDDELHPAVALARRPPSAVMVHATSHPGTSGLWPCGYTGGAVTIGMPLGGAKHRATDRNGGMRAGPPEAVSGSRRVQPTAASPGWASVLPICSKSSMANCFLKKVISQFIE